MFCFHLRFSSSSSPSLPINLRDRKIGNEGEMEEEKEEEENRISARVEEDE